MKILNTKDLKDCLAGTNTKDVLFDKQITKDFIMFLGQKGKLIYKEFIPKPYFSIIFKGKYTLKGSEGNRNCRLVLPKDEPAENMINDLSDLIKQYNEI